MSKRELVTVGNRAIAEYGERDAIRELGERLRRFLPSGDKMTDGDALSFAQAAFALDLNPFAGEIWYIPGVGIVTGIAGYRKMARRQGPFVAQSRQMTPQEREDHNLKPGDLGAICELYRPDQLRDAVAVNEAAGQIVIPIAPTIGVGIWRAAEMATRSGRQKAPPTARSWRWIAEKRAEADALRKSFDLTLAYAERGAPSIEGDMVIDEPVELSPWVVEALKDGPPPPSREELERQRAILRGTDEDADWDAPKIRVEEPEAADSEEEFIADMGAPAESEPHTDAVAEHDKTRESQSDHARSASLVLPVAWPRYAQVAMEALGYKSISDVAEALRTGGIDHLCTSGGVILFDPFDGWTVLSDAGPTGVQGKLPA